jgi:hypothetical protein
MALISHESSKSVLPKDMDLGNPRVMTSREAIEIEEIPRRTPDRGDAAAASGRIKILSHAQPSGPTRGD